MDKQITIRAPKKILAKWLRALRSGGYRQGRGALYKPKTAGFCCLGVLQHCVTGGEVEWDDKAPNDFPSQDWLRKNKIQFFDRSGSPDIQPFFPTLGKTAGEANDGANLTGKGKSSFKTIADAIEACAEGY